ncbi:hypothetical protein [Simiduia aestuariiviva]|uniref:MSHA biogenesis protein MshI n=1 Tax=Simiduia aestuariiviva TaxID=1510459 RepID=A0A839UTR0_9GAMM|nr:hypothetical protein [Simiduia aestuariiviva]MBB3168767.1 hypothetical protein [Simiduia aestuariiviva]
MSWQQINLYLPELQPSKELLTAKSAVGVLIFAVVLCLGLSALDIFENQHQKQKLQALRADFDAGQQRMTEVLAALPRSQAAVLQKELDEQRAELARRERIYQLIQSQNLGNSDGFSGQLQALARQHQSVLSLSAFSLLQGGQKITMAGEAKIAEAVPQYLQRLQYEPAFAQAVFGNMMIERTKSGRVQFSLTHDAQITQAGGRNGRP